MRDRCCYHAPRSLGGCNAQGEHNVCLQTWKERHALALLLSSAWRPLPRRNFRGTTKQQAEQAESKIKQEIFEGRFGKLDLGSEKLADFIEKIFVPWSKANKRSWRHDEFRARTIREYFGGKTFREISPLSLKNSNVTDANRSQRGRRFVV